MKYEMQLPEDQKIVIVKVRPAWDPQRGTPYLAFSWLEDDGHGARWYTTNEDGYACELKGNVVGWMEAPKEVAKELQGTGYT